MIRLVFRDIRSSLGRWLAIFAIIALGAGFLAGVMQSCPAMLDTMGRYVRDTALYDWRIVLPEGVDPSLTAGAAGVRGVRAVESAVQLDALADSVLGPDEAFRVHSVTTSLNHLTVRAGRLPERPDECFADGGDFGDDAVGTVITISGKNDPETKAKFAYDTYTIVGVGSSPVYLNYERGATTLGGGSVRAFLFLPRDGFADGTEDTEVFLALETEAAIYSESYDRILRLTQRRLMRFAEERPGGDSGSALLLSRNNNDGFASFRSDAEIVAGIARVFPVFFFLVAALVCVATMTRMVDEQRTQIGVLRALGFGGGRIAGVYLLYAGSAALLGCAAGFFLGVAAIPRLLWQVYNIMYQLSYPLTVAPDLALGGLLTAAFLAVSCLATALAVRRELRSAPAQLLRPRPPKAGRRLLLERVPGLRDRLDILLAVSLRNTVRDRGRLLMTVVGVAGCTALLLAGHGIRDSVGGIVGAQFSEVTLYDYLVVFSHEPDAAALADLDAGPGRNLAERQLMYQGSMDLEDGDTVKSVFVAAVPEGSETLMALRSGGAALPHPGIGEALICPKLAETFGLSVGDGFTLRSADGRRLTLTVSGVFDNYFYNYAIVDEGSFVEQWGEVPERRMLMANAAPEADIHRTAALLLDFDGVLSVSVSEDVAARVDRMMSALIYIVLLVVVCSGALAFIVLYNLTNINIIERIREIATVKVLGFYGRETAAYVFRENILLAALGALLGLPLGRALHRFVMAQIKVDLIHFRLYIAPASYLWSLALTFLFVAIVDVVMYFRLERIHMAEALKSVE